MSYTEQIPNYLSTGVPKYRLTLIAELRKMVQHLKKR